jgi:alpha-1,2-mannosyltransferase
VTFDPGQLVNASGAPGQAGEPPIAADQPRYGLPAAPGIRTGRLVELSSSLGRVSYRPPAWLLWVGCGSVVVSTSALYVALTHFKLFTGLDAAVYWRGAEALWHGRPLYESDPGVLPFTYPPVAAVLFTPMLLLSPYGAAKALGAISVACLFAVIWISLGMLGVVGVRGRVGLAGCITAAAVWFEPTMFNFQFGQINLVLLLLVIADIATPDRHWRKGIGVGLAAGVKLVPALFIVYFLATRRWRAAAVASGTFAASIAIGFVVAPGDSIEYWSHLSASSDRIQAVTELWYVGNQSVHGLLLRALGGTPAADRIWVGAAVVIAAGAVWLAARASRLGNELLAAVLVCLGGALVSPVSWTHHWVFVILLALVIWEGVWRWRTTLPRPGRAWYAWPVLVLPLVFLEWPVPTGEFGGLAPQGLVFVVPHLYANPPAGVDPELHWAWPQRLLGEAYTIAGLVFLVVCAAVLFGTSARNLAGQPRRTSVTSFLAEIPQTRKP